MRKGKRRHGQHSGAGVGQEWTHPWLSTSIAFEFDPPGHEYQTPPDSSFACRNSYLFLAGASPRFEYKGRFLVEDTFWVRWRGKGRGLRQPATSSPECLLLSAGDWIMSTAEVGGLHRRASKLSLYSLGCSWMPRI
ncbi:hypothetical protein BJX66DRAFT_308712, partial [Aspergillus keveii]